MKNILLIGDSIRKGYDKAVRKSLDGIANVYFPEENCRFAAYVLRYIHEYKDLVEDGRVDVLHWNAGLWDCLWFFGEEQPHTPVEIYAYYIERICQRIKILLPDTKVIFATSTRVMPEKTLKNYKRSNEAIEEYNRVAAAIVRKYGFEVNDLYALSTTFPDEAHSDDVHYYTPMATEAFTNQVLDVLRKAIDYPDTIRYQEELYTDAPIGV